MLWANQRRVSEKMERELTLVHSETCTCDQLNVAFPGTKCGEIRELLRSAIRVALEEARDKALEEAAAIAEHTTDLERGCLDVPDAIRALKSKRGAK